MEPETSQVATGEIKASDNYVPEETGGSGVGSKYGESRYILKVLLKNTCGCYISR